MHLKLKGDEKRCSKLAGRMGFRYLFTVADLLGVTFQIRKGRTFPRHF